MPPANPKFQDLIIYVVNIINDALIPLIFAIAVVLFIWGVVQYVINAQDTEKKAKGRQFMIWGIIALAVMISVWGLVRILGTPFGLKTNVFPQVAPTGQELQPVPSPTPPPSSSPPPPYQYDPYDFP